MELGSSPTRWYPVAGSNDAPFRHVAQAKLLGRELAVWRADDGYVNAWENRCLHRGVRLSVGGNEGTELRCLYHGWRYASRTGGCTYIPAHPADAPAPTICNQTFPCVERHGLIWVAEGAGSAEGEGAGPTVAALDAGHSLPLRALPFDAPPSLVIDQLAHYRFRPSALAARGDDGGEAAVTATVVDDEPTIGGPWFRIRSRVGEEVSTLIGFVQPVDGGHGVVRPVLVEGPSPGPGASDDAVIAVLRHHATALDRFRSVVEALAVDRPPDDPGAGDPQAIGPAPGSSEAAPTGPAPSGAAPTGDQPGRLTPRGQLTVRVARKWETAEDVMAFQLEAVSGLLPTAQPGAHLDVHLPTGSTRPYSLTNASGVQAHYVIGVRREPESRGGSAWLHDTLGEGDELTITAPRNNFPLRRDATRTVLVAGGIGITPLLAMAETLHAGRHRFELHHFARSADHVAFSSRLDALGPAVTTHLGLSPAGTGAELGRILARYEPSNHLYLCGPRALLDTARSIATNGGWPEAAVHVEHFQNPTELDRSTGFEVRLARSALTVAVEPGQTILDVLRANGITVDASCQQGACGTCIVGVLDGEPHHQDVYLTPTEQAAGDRIATCVSRAAGARLVLDV